MTLVLLHALGVDGTLFDDLRSRLAPMDTLAPDLPGHGATPALPLGSGIAEVAQWLAAWLEERELGAVDLLGVSLGGLVAQQLAATRPELVARLVVVDAVATYPDAMRTMWRDRAAAVRTDGVAAYVEPTLELWFTAAFRSAGEPFVEQVRAAVSSTPPEGYARACELLAEADLRPLLPRIDQPVLVLCGEDDAPPFRAALSELESSLDDVRSSWLPGRHAALLECATEALDPLAGFLTSPHLEKLS